MKRTILIMACALLVMAAQAQGKKVLVAYFSCTGNTEKVAKKIAAATKADIYVIQPKIAYTAEDINWHNKQSRSTVEMKDHKARPQLANKNAKIAKYDVVFLGYPIWWNTCPRIINTFIESYKWEGKTVVPFATSGSSSIDNSVKELKALYENVNWNAGKLLNGGGAEAGSWAKEVVDGLK